MQLADNDQAGQSRSAICITLMILGAYLLITTRATLWDRDEPRFARATVEMVESGDYLVPTFNGEWRLHKPILIYWLMSLPVRLLGPTELACRFFAAVGTAVTCLLTFLIARRLFDARAGLWAMLVLASGIMIMYIGTAATADAVLLPCMLGVITVFVYTLDRRMRFADIVLMALAAGLAQLAKGPVALLSVAVIPVTLLAGRKQPIRRGKYLWPVLGATIIGTLIFLAWAVPANKATGGEFLRFGVGKHVVGRSVSPMEHHGGKFLLYLPYYLPVILIGFFPWTLHLPGAVSAALGGRLGAQFRSLFIAWCPTILIFMTLVATKLPHYILFIWPAMALAVAGTIRAAQKQQLTERDLKWLNRGPWFFAPIAIAGLGGLIAAPMLPDVSGLAVPSISCAAVLAAMAIIAIRTHRRKGPVASAKALFIGMIVFQVPFLFGVLPAIERLKISPALAEAIKEQVAPDEPLAAYKFIEPTLVFYAGRNIQHLRSPADVVKWAAQPGRRALVMPADTLKQLQQKYGPLNLHVVARKTGYNYPKGEFREVLLLSGGKSR